MIKTLYHTYAIFCISFFNLAIIFRIFSIILIVCFPFVNTNIVGKYVYNQFHSGLLPDVPPRHSQYNRMHAPRTFYCHESRPSRRAATRTFPRAIRKIAPAALSAVAAPPLLLLMKWRFLRDFMCTDLMRAWNLYPRSHGGTGKQNKIYS